MRKTELKKAVLRLADGQILRHVGRMFDPVEKLKEFIRHPSVSADSKFGEGMRGAQKFVADLLGSMGFDVEVVPTELHPIILASRGSDPSWPHVVIYGHYDVQPADPLNLWTTPAFEPSIRGNRIYGRGAADNKGPLITNIAAVARLLEANPNLPLRITFLIEGEEEMGSPSFPKFLERYKDRLKAADFVYLSDTALPNEQQVVLTCGLRGLTLFDVHITGAKGDLHSGLHGGVLRNPIQALAEIIATLHTPEGKVNVPGLCSTCSLGSATNSRNSAGMKRPTPIFWVSILFTRRRGSLRSNPRASSRRWSSTESAVDTKGRAPKR